MLNLATKKDHRLHSVNGKKKLQLRIHSVNGKKTTAKEYLFSAHFAFGPIQTALRARLGDKEYK